LTDPLGFDSAIAITNYYHITRTRLTFAKFGIKRVYTAHANFFEWRDGYSLLREFFGYYKYLLLRYD